MSKFFDNLLKSDTLDDSCQYFYTDFPKHIERVTIANEIFPCSGDQSIKMTNSLSHLGLVATVGGLTYLSNRSKKTSDPLSYVRNIAITEGVLFGIGMVSKVMSDAQRGKNLGNDLLDDLKKTGDLINDKVLKPVEKEIKKAVDEVDKKVVKPVEKIVKESYNRGVGTPLQCGPNEDQIAGLCYPKAKPNFKCDLTECFEKCPSGWNDDGLTCRKDDGVIGRGVGVVKNRRCPNGYSEYLGSCYVNVKNEWSNAVRRTAVCTAVGRERQCHTCEFGDDGTYCKTFWGTSDKGNPKCRTVDKTWTHCGKFGKTKPAITSCPSSHPDEQAGLCYKPKPPNATSCAGPTCNTLQIKSKQTYTRGAGKPIHACPSGKINEAGLCYSPCKDSFTGVGPSCVKNV